MENKDIEKFVNGKENEILDLSIGKVKVIKSDYNCNSCFLTEYKKKDNYCRDNCHHFCCKKPERPYRVIYKGV